MQGSESPGQGRGPHVPTPPSTPAPKVVKVRVTKRLLWVGEEVYPLQNIARIHTFTLTPRRDDAVKRFLKRTALVFAAGTIINAVAYKESDSGGSSPAVSIIVLAVTAYLFFTELLPTLRAKSEYALSVEASGPPTTLLTSDKEEQLKDIARKIALAIDSPDEEFQFIVNTVIVNPNDYHFGDNVNIYGGVGNVGVERA